MLIITYHYKVITNYVSFSYYKLRKSVVTNYDILKIATGITNYDKIIINYQSYYKLRHEMNPLAGSTADVLGYTQVRQAYVSPRSYGNELVTNLKILPW